MIIYSLVIPPATHMTVYNSTLTYDWHDLDARVISYVLVKNVMGGGRVRLCSSVRTHLLQHITIIGILSEFGL